MEQRWSLINRAETTGVGEEELNLDFTLPTKSNSKYILSLGVKYKPIKLPEGSLRDAKMALGMVMTF